MHAASHRRSLRIGIDIGGTFTDLLMVDDLSGATSMVKVLTTSDDPSRGVELAVREALEQAAAAPADVSHVVHGTTLVTNAIIERKGDRTALITTRGFRDALEIRREHRYDMYDLFLEMPAPLVPRHLRFEIDERTLADGTVLREPLEGEIERLVTALAGRGIGAIAVSLLHAYQNPANERGVGEVIARCGGGIEWSLSSDVAPEIKEYERTSTTVCNVYVKRLVAGYLAEIERRLQAAGVDATLYVMLSSGGLATVETSRRFPIRLLESGPAAGALAAAHAGTQVGISDLMSFDMGGTTAKVAIIEAGAPLRASQFEVDRVYRFKKGSGLPVKTPVVELIEIGAGGGSIARVDRLGRLQVGPESAAATPGPACYGRGGTQPTVTDADLVLGYLDPEFFLGGRMPLDVAAARRAIEENICRPLGVGLAAAAWAIHHIVNENMANAARIHAVDRGKDPRAFPFFAFGGAGPVHAAAVADILGSPSIMLPLGAGVGSTVGFLAAPLAFDFSRTSVEPLEQVDWTRAERLRAEMEEEGMALLERAGLARTDLTVSQSVDLRYVGQGHEVAVPLEAGPYAAGRLPEITRAFSDIYRRLYRRVPGVLPIETVNWRLRVSGPAPALAVTSHVTSSSGRPTGSAVVSGFSRTDDSSVVSGFSRTDDSDVVSGLTRTGVSDFVSEFSRTNRAHKGDRPVYFPRSGGFTDTPVYDRYRLGAVDVIDGPAIVEERESTVVVPPGWVAAVDKHANLVLRRTDGS